MSFWHSLAKVGTALVDPLNITGIQDANVPSPFGGPTGASTGGEENLGVHVGDPTPAMPQMPIPAKGFLASMAPEANLSVNRDMFAPPPAPNAGWSYTPGHGVTWQTPQWSGGINHNNGFLQNQGQYNWTTEAPGTPAKGNRI